MEIIGGSIRFNYHYTNDIKSIHFRTLYDFFNSVGIEIDLRNKHVYSDCMGIRMELHYDDKSIVVCGNTRTEAEYRAFEKAFEIREQQLAKSVKEESFDNNEV